LRRLVDQINQLVHKLNTLGTNAMTAAGAVASVSLQRELARIRTRAVK
jgi:hypothetical protein